MTTYLDVSGKIWMALSGFDWIWEDLDQIQPNPTKSFGWIWLDLVQIRVLISKLDFVGYGRNYRDYRRIWMDLA